MRYEDLNVLFIFDTIQVFMKPIDQKREKLLCILLLSSTEIWIDFTYDSFEMGWRKNFRDSTPSFPDEFCISFGQSSFCPQFISFVNFFFKETFQKVFCQGCCVGKALKTRVHVTSISEVFQTHPSSNALLILGHYDRFVELLFLCVWAIGLMSR